MMETNYLILTDQVRDIIHSETVAVVLLFAERRKGASVQFLYMPVRMTRQIWINCQMYCVRIVWMKSVDSMRTR